MPAHHTPIELKVNIVGWEDVSQADRERIEAAHRRLDRHIGEIIFTKLTQPDRQIQ